MTQFNFAEVENIEPDQPQKTPETLPATRPLDIEAAKKAFEPYRQKIAAMQKEADSLEIATDEGEKQAVDAAAQAKRLVNDLEGQRKKVIKDPDRFVRDVNAFVRVFRKPLDQVVEVLRGKIGGYQFAKEVERRKIAKAMEEEARQLQEKLKAEAKEAGIEAPPVMPVPAPKPESITRTEGGASASIRNQWVGEIQNPDQVPREFCSPDQQKINQAVKAGIREIPGCRIYERPVTVLRA
jgi:nucleotide-binding universal stress UspA family protein